MPWWMRLLYRVWLRLQGLCIDHVVAMDSPCRDEIRKAIGLPDEAITVIPDPALSQHLIEKLGSRQVSARAPRGRRCVAIGRLVPQKNLPLMLRAFRRAAEPEDTLTFVGDGSEKASLQKLSEQLGLADRVSFRGYVADPATLVADFDALLLSSSYEGVPAAVLEAVAANLEIVATNCCRSMASILKYGQLGQLVPVGDEDALAEAITLLRAGGRDRALGLAQARRFTIESAAPAYLTSMTGMHTKCREARMAAWMSRR
jgi:glycosyltransferase involved in cell wall biosynthesis